MSAPLASPPEPPTTPRSFHANTIVAVATVLALLYFGRDVLVPITLAVILSLLIAPLVRVLRRLGLGHVPSVLAAVLALAIFLLGLAAMIGTQVAAMATSLPQYQETVRSKAKTLRELTLGRVEAVRGEAGRVINQFSDQAASAPGTRTGRQRQLAPSNSVVPVEIHERQASPLELIGRVLASIWVPLETAGIVFVVLVFVLLEHEALRDRFIRLAGGTDLRGTTNAVNDAGERLSRFFVSQFAVNLAVGSVVGAGLAIIGLPHALLWGALTAVLRFVPYVGVWIAALLAGLLASAVDPGWSLLIMTGGLFAIVEAVVAQGVEPHLYGHTTGLSPLSVVIATIFWSWLWGPVGLIVSTPLTLCLLVAGRHVQSLTFLDILLGDTPALTMPERFYQRALSGDADEIIASARVFLKRRSFAAYCDTVLMRALNLARLDLATGTINPEQQLRVRGAIIRVIEALGSATRKESHRQRRISVLDDANPGRQLRRLRERVSGQWQGPLGAPAGSVVLCVGLGSVGDDLATELLVRILRDKDIDARHFSVEEIEGPPPPGAKAESISMVFIVSIAPRQERESGARVAAEMRQRLPEACIVAVLFPDLLSDPDELLVSDPVNLVATSFEEAMLHANTRFPGNAKHALPSA